MKFMIQVAALGIFINCISCKANKSMQGNTQVAATPIILDKSLTKVFDTSHSIDTAFVQSDILTLKISCFNVCLTDTFELVGNGKFAKSNPPITAVFIRRKSSNTDCKNTIKKELKFEVGALKYPLQNKVVINLDEHYKITYNY